MDLKRHTKGTSMKTSISPIVQASFKETLNRPKKTQAQMRLPFSFRKFFSSQSLTFIFAKKVGKKRASEFRVHFHRITSALRSKLNRKLNFPKTQQKSRKNLFSFVIFSSAFSPVPFICGQSGLYAFTKGRSSIIRASCFEWNFLFSINQRSSMEKQISQMG